MLTLAGLLLSATFIFQRAVLLLLLLFLLLSSSADLQMIPLQEQYNDKARQNGIGGGVQGSSS